MAKFSLKKLFAGVRRYRDGDIVPTVRRHLITYSNTKGWHRARKSRLDTSRKLTTPLGIVKQQKKHELTKTIQKKCDVVRNNPNKNKLAKSNEKKVETTQKNQKENGLAKDSQKRDDIAMNNQKTGVQENENQEVDDQPKRNQMEDDLEDLVKRMYDLSSESASHTDNVIGETLVKAGQPDNADRDNDKGSRGIENANTTILKQAERDIQSMSKHGEGNTEPLNLGSHLPEQNLSSISIKHASCIATHPKGMLRKPDQSLNNSYTDIPVTVLNKTSQKLSGNAESKIPVMNQTLPLPAELYQRQDACRNKERNCGIFKGKGAAQSEKRGHYQYSQQPSRPSASGYYRPEQSTNKSQNPVESGNSIVRPSVVSRNPTPNSRLATDSRRRSFIETAPSFCCSQCPQLFQTYADLKVHEYTCLPKNRKMYSYRSNRENISAGELHRSINYHSPASDDGVECRYCGAFFLECAALDVHVNNIHPKKWGCLYCTLKSRGPVEANTHTRNCDNKNKFI